MNSHLIGLGNVGEYGVHHADEHSVLKGVSCVLDDRNHIRPRLGHVDQVSSRAVGELHSIHASRRSHDIGNVRDSGARGGTEIQYLKSRQQSRDTGGQTINISFIAMATSMLGENGQNVMHRPS